MGGSLSHFSPDELSKLESNTFLTREEIEKVWKMYSGLGGTMHIPVSGDKLPQIPAFRFNPFTPRLVPVFGDAQSNTMNWDQFLDLFSVLSMRADPRVKLQAAFHIFDMDNDSYISETDLVDVIRLLSGNELSDEEVLYCTKKAMDEADIDSSGSLSFLEFSRVASRIPDFNEKFVVYIM
eukprot:ANDGO_04314.mRNA.1 Calcineurin subunit B